MEKRKYTKIQVLETEIVSMHRAGKTHREIAEYFGLERSQVKKCLERFRCRQRKQAAGIQPKPKGRPRKDGQPPHQSEAAELKRLRMENQLLRDFLKLSERGCVREYYCLYLLPGPNNRVPD